MSGDLDRPPSQKGNRVQVRVTLWADGKMGDKTIPETMPKWNMHEQTWQGPRGHRLLEGAGSSRFPYRHRKMLVGEGSFRRKVEPGMWDIRLGSFIRLAYFKGYGSPNLTLAL